MATDRHIHDYIGDGAYIYMDDWRGVVFYTSDGITETNRVVIDVADVPTMMMWLRRREEFLAKHDARKRAEAEASEEE